MTLLKKFYGAIVLVIFSVAFSGAAAAQPAAAKAPLDVEHWRSLYSNMVLVLLDDSAHSGDGEMVAENVVERGGAVPIVFDREAVVAYLPPDEALTPLAHLPHVRSAHRQSVSADLAAGRHQAESAVKYFNAAKSGTLLRQLIEASDLPPLDLGPDGRRSTGVAPSLAFVPNGDSWATPRFRAVPAAWSGRNASLNGRIHSSVFFVQCSNSQECQFTWDQVNLDDVTNRIVSGYQYWSDTAQRYGKSPLFTIRTYSPFYTPNVIVPVEPVPTRAMISG